MPSKTEERIVIENKWQLMHFLQIAAETFRQDAANLRLEASAGDNVMITRKAAEQLAVEFDQYELQANALRNTIERAERVEIITDRDDSQEGGRHEV